jgi:hypothetical protein
MSTAGWPLRAAYVKQNLDALAPRRLSQRVGEFTAAATESYDRFMGRYAVSLAPKLADAVGVAAGMRVVETGRSRARSRWSRGVRVHLDAQTLQTSDAT